jgi:hypothetical protein
MNDRVTNTMLASPEPEALLNRSGMLLHRCE